MAATGGNAAFLSHTLMRPTLSPWCLNLACNFLDYLITIAVSGELTQIVNELFQCLDMHGNEKKAPKRNLMRLTYSLK